MSVNPVIPASVAGGLLFGLLVGGALHARRVRRLEAGWNLVKVTAAARPLQAGTVVDASMLEQRRFPEQWVTRSVIKDSSSDGAMGQVLGVNRERGEPLLRSDFAAAWDPAACLAACAPAK